MQNGEYNGLVGELQRGDSDLGWADIFVSYERYTIHKSSSSYPIYRIWHHYLKRPHSISISHLKTLIYMADGTI